MTRIPDTIISEWTDLLEDAHPESRFVTLATVGLDGSPRARIVGWRGFDAERGSIWLSADAASEKMKELESDPRGVVVAWDRRRRAQWRIRCDFRAALSPEWEERYARLGAQPVAIIGRQEAWRRHGENSKVTFYWPEPGQPLREEHQRVYAKSLERCRREASLAVPERFVVLEGVIREMERLELVHPAHRRSLFRRDEEWAEQAVTP